MRPALVAAAALAALVLGAQASARSDCTAGVRTVKGVTYRTFCGPAKAYATVGSVKHTFGTGGECTRSGGYWTINVGTITLPPGTPKHAYFGITVRTTHAGTFTNNGAVAWQLPGKRVALISTTVTIEPGMKKGTFSGKVLGSAALAHGSFTC